MCVRVFSSAGGTEGTLSLSFPAVGQVPKQHNSRHGNTKSPVQILLSIGQEAFFRAGLEVDRVQVQLRSEGHFVFPSPGTEGRIHGLLAEGILKNSTANITNGKKRKYRRNGHEDESNKFTLPCLI